MGLGHSPIVVSEGLVFYFDPINTRSYAGTGLTGYNLINTAIVGTFTNGPAYDSANKGSINFDGVDDRISFSFNSALDISQSITIEAYIKPQSYPTAGGGGMILTKVISYYLEFASTGKIRVYFDGLSSPGYHESTNTVPLNKWTHVAVTRDSSNSTINIFINGVLDKTVTGITGNITVQQTYSLAMGGYNGGGYLFVGLITCGKIYNRALSSTEILQNYNVTKKRFSPEENIVTNGLVLNLDAGNNLSYPGTGITAINIAGVGVTGVLTNGVGFGVSSGGSFIFDGTNDHIDCGNDSSLSNIGGTANITASAWVYYTAYGGGGQPYSVITVKGFPWTWLLENPSNIFTFRISAGGSDVNIVDTSTHLLNTWYNVVGTYNGSVISIYVNGVLKNARVQTGTLGTNSETAKIGTYQGTNYNLTGRIANVYIYNRTLSSTEILQNYNALKSRYGLS